MTELKASSTDTNDATCEGCGYNRKGQCRLNPPLPWTQHYMEDQGHPMLPEVPKIKTIWVFPPAKVRCGQYDGHY